MSKARPPLALDPFSSLGRTMLSAVAGFGEACLLYFKSLKSLLSGTIFWKNTFLQMEMIGLKSLPIVLVISIFTGMVFSLQIAKIFATFGLSSQLGQGLTLAFARELAPVLTGVVVAGRIGSSIAAEIGSMKVTEQIEALEALSTDPIDYLVAPRIVAASLMLPVLVVFADFSGIIGGFLIAAAYANIPVKDFIDGILTFVNFWDFCGGVVKAACFGMIIAGVGSFKGLKTENGAVGVGKATTESVVISTILLFILNYFLSMILYRL
jgi:phospholipid/cholesterol/gamma-HCH transport system permease protein